MTRETLVAALEWGRTLAHGDSLQVTFHGGEPLVAGDDFYRMALPLVHESLTARSLQHQSGRRRSPQQPLRVGIQSNLWLLTDESAELFAAYGVRVGTSLDGPRALNDRQRGTGSFGRTMTGIEQARAHGLRVGAICTVTSRSVEHADEIFDFFVSAGLDFSLHPAVVPLGGPEVRPWAVEPEDYGRFLIHLFDRYLDERPDIHVGSFVSMAESISAGRGGICTFDDCLGSYLAVGPDGAMYPCQRFVGVDEYRLGYVIREPSWHALREAPAWRRLRARQEAMATECSQCAYLAFCHGGCPYDALAAGDLQARDPHCTAYSRLFAHIIQRAVTEVLSPENLRDAVDHPEQGPGLLRRGRLLSLMREEARSS